MKIFSSIPFLRILLPFVTGILLALWFTLPGIGPVYFLVLLCLLGIAVFYRPLKVSVFILADLFLLLYGASLVQQADTSRHAGFYGNYIPVGSEAQLTVVLNELPVEKEKTVKCLVKVLEVRQEKNHVPVTGSMLLYFRKSAAAVHLRAGNTLLVKTALVELPEPLNPFEFDYKAYLRNKQVHHIAFVDSAAFEIAPVQTPLNRVWKAGLDCKHFILQRLKNSPLSEDARSICAALLTGYDDDIDRPVMDAFAHSGTLHVLSVSGLHTGLIYLLLGFLFDLADRKRRFKLLKFCFITLALWLFALITGFSAPVLRAVIMFNLFGLGAIYFRNDARNQVNILLVSAFMLLCYDPFFITDVGFLLSYFALFGLIYFQPRLSANWTPRNRLVNYVWQSTTASVAATVSTLPLTLFWFKQFPLWFFICNLVVVPATFVILFLALFVVLKVPLAAAVINLLTGWLIAFIGLFNSEGIGFIDQVHFSFTDVLYLSVFILLFSAAIHYRSYRAVVTSLVILLAWQFTSLIDSYTAKKQSLLAVYQLKNKSLLSVKNKTGVSLSARDSASYNYHIKPHLVTFNYPEIITQPFNYVEKAGCSVLLLDTANAWPRANYSSVTTLILANNVVPSETDLQRFARLETIVADGSNNNRAIKKSEDLSRKFGVNFYNTKLKGAYLLTL